jgi:hypothetical protein
MMISRNTKWLYVLIVAGILSTILYSQGFCDNWIYAARSNYIYTYYDNSNIAIDSRNKHIKVWIKYKYTNEGREYTINKRRVRGLSVTNYEKLYETNILMLFDYEHMIFQIKSLKDYTHSGKILASINNPNNKWTHTTPGSIVGHILKRIMQDYQLK